MAEQKKQNSPEVNLDHVSEKKSKTDNIKSNEEVSEIVIEPRQTEADFALKLVDTLISLNNEEISSFEAINRFETKAELSCFIIFARSVPINPIVAVYPEGPFLIFRGVSVPRSVNLTEKNLAEIEEKIMSTNDISNDNLHLLDLPPEILNAFEMAITIYNGKAEKVRTSYLAAVKNAKSQVIEVSAASICVIIIITTALALLSN
tara:strand:- start:390 stop:1004 length:615 start_codon:yes stop_codon:yes gene_type:complete